MLVQEWKEMEEKKKKKKYVSNSFKLLSDGYRLS
jgi:hypothetical protein